MPSGKDMKADRPEMVTWMVWMLNVVDWCYKAWIGRKGVRYSYLVGKGSAEVLERMVEWVEEGKLRPVVGRRARLGDIEGVREGCQQIFEGKGGVGKFVIEVD
jgi:NADPH:quinone reductase-like Zn-dependent oxidoreductase